MGRTLSHPSETNAYDTVPMLPDDGATTRLTAPGQPTEPQGFFDTDPDLIAEPRERSRSTGVIAISLAAAAALVAGMVTLVRVAEASEPGDLLYPLDRVVEDVLEVVAPGEGTSGQFSQALEEEAAGEAEAGDDPAAEPQASLNAEIDPSDRVLFLVLENWDPGRNRSLLEELRDPDGDGEGRIRDRLQEWEPGQNLPDRDNDGLPDDLSDRLPDDGNLLDGDGPTIGSNLGDGSLGDNLPDGGNLGDNLPDGGDLLDGDGPTIGSDLGDGGLGDNLPGGGGLLGD